MTDFRANTLDLLQQFMTAPEASLPGLLEGALSLDSKWSISHPINDLHGPVEVLEGFVLPLRHALSHVRRRDEIFIGGQNIRQPGGTWCASIAHYVGNFAGVLMGITPSERLAFLRTGEFYRIDDGKITEAKIILDFVDLMRQAGRMP
ncbi:MAG: ester cyclase, partial [Pseudomonadota bacterium]